MVGCNLSMLTALDNNSVEESLLLFPFTNVRHLLHSSREEQRVTEVDFVNLPILKYYLISREDCLPVYVVFCLVVGMHFDILHSKLRAIRRIRTMKGLGRGCKAVNHRSLQAPISKVLEGRA